MPGYGTPLGLTLPTPSVDTEAVAASKLNTALSAIIARLESKVAATDLDIASDVSFKSGAVYSGAKDLQRAAFQSQTGALTTVSNPNTVYVLNGDLHYIDQAGNLVQITASGAVNVSTTGGVTGAGYGTGGVEVNWDSVNTRYRMRSGAGVDSFADVQCADLILNDASGNNIRFQAPAVASDYTATLPTGLPGSTSLLQWTSAGLMSSTTAPTLTGLTVNGAATVNGAIAANGAVTLSSNSSVTVSGTGQYKRPARYRNISVLSGQSFGTSAGFNTSTWQAAAGGNFVVVPLLVTEAERIVEVRCRVDPFNGGGGQLTASVLGVAADGTLSVLAGPTASSGTSDQSIVLTLSETVLAASVWYLAKITANAGGDQVVGVLLQTDVP